MPIHYDDVTRLITVSDRNSPKTYFKICVLWNIIKCVNMDVILSYILACGLRPPKITCEYPMSFSDGEQLR